MGVVPTWLSVVIAGCALAITAVEVIVRAGFWAGRVDQRSSAGERTDQRAEHVVVMAKLDAIHADTTKIRQQGHDIANQLVGMKGLEQLVRDEIRGRRGR